MNKTAYAGPSKENFLCYFQEGGCTYSRYNFGFSISRKKYFSLQMTLIWPMEVSKDEFSK